MWGGSTSGCSYAARSAVPWSRRFGAATTGGSAIKRYRPTKKKATGGGWQHPKVTLSPTNPDYEAIVLTKDDANDVQVVAGFVTVLR